MVIQEYSFVRYCSVGKIVGICCYHSVAGALRVSILVCFIVDTFNIFCRFFMRKSTNEVYATTKIIHNFANVNNNWLFGSMVLQV